MDTVISIQYTERKNVDRGYINNYDDDDDDDWKDSDVGEIYANIKSNLINVDLRF